LAQEAHEAIRPTSVQLSASSIQLGNDFAKLYELIWKRAVASQMSDAQIESTTVIVDTNDTNKYSSSERSESRSNDEIVLDCARTIIIIDLKLQEAFLF